MRSLVCVPLHLMSRPIASGALISVPSQVVLLQVVTLRTEVLLRALGPLAGLLETALMRSPSDSRSNGISYSLGTASVPTAASGDSGPGSRVSTCGSGLVQSSPPPGASNFLWTASSSALLADKLLLASRRCARIKLL